MSRAKRGFKARRRRNRVLKHVQGFFGSRSRIYRIAKVAQLHSMYDAYKSRRQRRRDIRRLWITRIGAAAKNNGTSYSRLIGGLSKANVALDRKILADLAVADPNAFAKVAKIAMGGTSSR